MGAASQFRMMGSAIAAAVTTTVYNGYTRPRLESLNTSDWSSSLTGQVDGQDDITRIYAGGYNLQMIVLAVFAAAQIPSALLFWKNPQIRA
jgi:hypothetical protein